MKNCLDFAVTSLTELIVTLGVFQMIDVLNMFDVFTDVITLDCHYRKTEDLSKVRYGATRSAQGHLNLKAQSDLVKMMVNIICNPGSPEEAVNINSALKTLCIKIDGNASRFYGLLSEGLQRRMLFQKFSQLYGPLIEEIKINKELLIMLINNKLIDMKHLNELSFGVDGSVQAARIAHYIIHNINHYERVKNFLYIMQRWTRDKNLVEDLEEIVFDIEMVQKTKIEDKIQQDIPTRLCQIY